MTILQLLVSDTLWSNLAEILTGYTTADALLKTCLTVMVITALLCFLISEITRNYSQVDKVWSLMPIIYAGICLAAFPGSLRLWLMTLLVTFWGLRLSYNFSRKGGYHPIPWKGEEDYRWAILRKHPLLNKRWKFMAFNFLFISLYQHLLILLFSTPLLLAASFSEIPLNWLDVLAAAAMILFISIETMADNQQYRFHQLKKGKIQLQEVYTRSLGEGFLSEGLWARVRHPNFMAEQALWLSFYFFGVAASGYWLNPTLAGSVLLILLFIGSTAMTENISRSKYPGYLLYQKQVPRLIPSLRKRSSR